ncbi:MAG TPA: 3-isopropylmalate dehydrogenase, partial [Desulfomicrobiaceae bacterium]|nr:3-isopropylmalate dehydrogenase [Desulfomicrobiaceae bacterium]
MTTSRRKWGPFPSADADARSARLHAATPQCQSPSYTLAFQDNDFLLREELRPVRLQLELLKPELALQEQGIESTIVMYGSARLLDPDQARDKEEQALAALKKDPLNPGLEQDVAKARKAVRMSRYYEESRKLGRLVSTHNNGS